MTTHSGFGVIRIAFTRSTRFIDNLPREICKRALCSPRAMTSAPVSCAATLSRMPQRLATACVLPNHGGALFGDHHGGRIGVAGRDGRHDRGIDHPQPFEADGAQALVPDPR